MSDVIAAGRHKQVTRTPNAILWEDSADHAKLESCFHSSGLPVLDRIVNLQPPFSLMITRLASRKRAHGQGTDSRDNKKIRVSSADDGATSSTISSVDHKQEVPSIGSTASAEKSIDAHQSLLQQDKDFVKAPASNEAETVITPRTRGGFTLHLCSRLNQLNAYFSGPTSVATLNTLTFDSLHWGPTDCGETDESAYLFLGEKPLTLWSVAEIHGMRLREKNGPLKGTPLRSQGLIFKPLLKRDFDMGCRIVSDLAQPIKPYDRIKNDGLWASRWIGAPNTPAHRLPIMDKVYDATSTYSGKKKRMPLYSAEELKRGDVVIVELMVARWVPDAQKDDNASPTKANASPSKTTYGGKREWKKWVVDFRLRAISILHIAPADNMPHKEDEDFTV